MKALSFVLGLVVVVGATAGWSLAAGAGLGTTLLRVALAVLLAQGVYLAAILLLAWAGRRDGSAPKATPRQPAEPRLPYPSKESGSSG